MNRCSCICLTKGFDFTELKKHFAERFTFSIYRDALHLELSGHAFIFDYGVLVLWGLSDKEQKMLCQDLETLATESLSTPVTDEFSFEINASHNSIHGDHIALSGHEPLDLLAVSHGLAQSSILAVFENQAIQTIEENTAIPSSLAENGTIRISRKTIGKMRGRLFLVESDINLHYGLLDTPEFFWDYPDLEEQYLMTTRYLDVQPRVEVLNRKLGIIRELFDMLADEQKHKHSSLLEWIIIWLIAIEIVFFLGQELLELL
ncbi:MAG: RMD1 family protein [Candidatus Thiodiazotropha sp.]|jgi:uncharacterized Rmd1/YagE family protein